MNVVLKIDESINEKKSDSYIWSSLILFSASVYSKHLARKTSDRSVKLNFTLIRKML